MIEPLTYIRIWETTGNIAVLEDHWHRLVEACGNWTEKGQDSLVPMTTLSGARYITKASNILCWLLDSPETRLMESKLDVRLGIEKKEAEMAMSDLLLRDSELEAELETERRSRRVEAGLPWEDRSDDEDD